MSKIIFRRHMQDRARDAFYVAMCAEFTRLQRCPPDPYRIFEIERACNRIVDCIRTYIMREAYEYKWPTAAEAMRDVGRFKDAIVEIQRVPGAVRLLLGERAESLENATRELGFVEMCLDDVTNLDPSKRLLLKNNADALLFQVVRWWTHGVGTPPGKTENSASGCLTTLKNTLSEVCPDSDVRMPKYTFATYKRAIDRFVDRQARDAGGSSAEIRT